MWTVVWIASAAFAFLCLLAYHRLIVFWVLGMRAYVLWCVSIRAGMNCLAAVWRLHRLPHSLNELWIAGPFHSVEENFNRPVTSGAGATIAVVRRVRCGRTGRLVPEHPLKRDSGAIPYLNTGSYNYLGYGGGRSVQLEGVAEAALQFSKKERVRWQTMVERGMCRFLGDKPACIVQATGYATNACILPLILELWPNTLMLSDAFNHTSIVMGAKAARNGTEIRVFRHSDVADLKRAYSENGGSTRNRVLVVVEGLYSMEGTYCPLPEIVRWCNTHTNVWLYVDEAHSIGAVGRHGKGVCDHYDIPTQAVHFLMGTFTKSFASVGGYVTFPTVELAEEVRRRLELRHGPTTPLPSACSAQILGVLHELATKTGRRRVRRLHRNARTVRSRLIAADLEVLGEHNSPVIPIMVRDFGFLDRFNHACLDLGMAVVTVGYPATPLLDGGRARLCMSAAHTNEHVNQIIDTVIGAMRAVTGGDAMGMVISARMDPHGDRGGVPAPILLLDPTTTTSSSSSSSSRGGKKMKNGVTLRKLGVVVERRRDLGAPPPSTEKGRGDVLPQPCEILDVVVSRTITRALARYGVGSCGPRGFYGTMTPHTDLERVLAQTFHKADCALYPHTQCLASSVLPALVRTSAPLSILQRLGIASVDVLYYVGVEDIMNLRYDLRLALDLVRCRVCQGSVANQPGAGGDDDTTNGTVPIRICKTERPVIVVSRTQEARSLHEDMLHRGVRDGALIILDACLLSLRDAVSASAYCDVIMGSLENEVPGLGGFCVASEEIVRYQRLYGKGYVFSASPPPYVCCMASKVVEWVTTRGGADREYKNGWGK